jgi:hypothetical protein
MTRGNAEGFCQTVYAHYGRTAGAAFLFLWVTIVFAGAEIKLHDAPPPQDGCFIQQIAQHLNLDVRPDCKADDSLFALIAATPILDELEEILPPSVLSSSPTLDQIIDAVNVAANSSTTNPADQKKISEVVSAVNANKDLFEVVLELQRSNYDPSKQLDLGEDRYIGPWRTGKHAFAGKAYKCSEALFANDIGDYFNFLMGNVCTGAIEMRCIFSRITHILMSLSALYILIVVFMYDRGRDQDLGWISTVLVILCLLLIVILPMITAVQTTRSVTKSFAAPGTNKRLGAAYEFGILAPFIDPLLSGNLNDSLSTVQVNANGATVAGSLLRLGTIPHDTQGECGLGWSESVVALVDNLASPVVISAVTLDDDGNGFTSTLLAILDMLKYTVELTVVFYLRLVTIPVAAIILLICALGTNKTLAYTKAWDAETSIASQFSL